MPQDVPNPGHLRPRHHGVPGFQAADRTLPRSAIDTAVLDDTTERGNITLPRRMLKRLDALARVVARIPNKMGSGAYGPVVRSTPPA